MKKYFSKRLALLSITTLMLGGANVSVYAQASSPMGNVEITPFFIAIISCDNSLTLGSSGKLSCSGSTHVQRGYVAGLTMELQQNNGGWTTIKTWSDSDTDWINLEKDWHVEKGYSYRLKVTHTSISGGKVLESETTYSKTVSY